MRKTARRLIAASLLLPTTLLAGCWDMERLENLAIISTIGIDTLPQNRLEVTVAVTNPATATSAAGQSGGGATRKASSLIYTVQGRSVNDALKQLDLFKSRRPADIQTRVLLVSEAKARDGLLPELSTFLRFLEFRRTIRVFVVEGRVSDFLRRLKPDLQVTPTAHLESMGSHETTARIPIPDHDIHDFMLHTLPKGREAVLPLVRPTSRSGSGQGGSEAGTETDGGGQQGRRQGSKIGGGKEGLPEITGLAVFRGGKMVGKMGVDELIPYHLLTEPAIEAYVTVEGRGGPEGSWQVTVALSSKTAPGIEVRRRPDRDLIKATLKLDGPIVEVRGGETLSYGWLETEIEPRVEAALTRDVNRLIGRAQEEWRSDIFGFGRKVRRTFSTWKEWKNYPWDSRFPEAEVQVKLEVNIQTTGRSTRPAGAE